MCGQRSNKTKKGLPLEGDELVLEGARARAHIEGENRLVAIWSLHFFFSSFIVTVCGNEFLIIECGLVHKCRVVSRST